ncbi:hypothetical protein ASF04_02830 [Duganella sp. Leaf61]|nr:hypothetical protein ASF04_02830 [Duganella sp. Leaf61]
MGERAVTWSHASASDEFMYQHWPAFVDGGDEWTPAPFVACSHQDTLTTKAKRFFISSTFNRGKNRVAKNSPESLP